ncbi:hypothetical protein BN7_2514 [Wickerhamomyces ciferrii]|uniref:Protein CASP n=1 Tax=Wickerhamomyces ciferrii (strain ATCC 14091 / BCRC 22168 / CBS 111 / JCM 3599 / NBRC 0793 / NRRL Y-1031 F-60-10) TaxID=1206466 RepID=K0KPA3_WICCF|nr:uncharacterized protein BN7_2514 [Wickerhamomyces ciferrii]CCH42968.1 hypothetical protein BN7_2514 [Wickerhamomyces ciferrii]
MSTQSTFEKALLHWSEVNLPQLQQSLDDPATQIHQTQEETLSSRKTLAQRTKEFKKLEEDSKLKEIKPLLKLYQTEIDTLTERAKLSEGAFFNVYRAISELPDPKPLLEVSLDSVLVAQEVDSLKKENENLRDELLKYADYEQLKQRLLRSEEQNVEQLNNKLKLKEEELKGEFEEKESNWNEKEINYQKQIDSFQKQIIDLKTQNEVDGLRLQNQASIDFDDSGNSVKNEDLEFIKRENENVHLRNLQLEKRNQDLSKELKIIKSDSAQKEVQYANESKINQLESENATLVAKLDYESRSFETKQQKSSTVINSYKRDIDQLNNELKNLKIKMNSFKDYDDLKHELNTLRTIAFGSNDDDQDDQDQDQDDEELGDEPIKSSSSGLDEILVSRNKKLTNEITKFRSKHEELNEKILNLEKLLNKSNNEVTRLVSLNNQLENDLSLFNQSKISDNISMISGVTRNTRAPIPTTRGGRLSPTSSIAGGLDPSTQSNVESESSVLPIITSQRDRFRSRNIELESLLKTKTNQINELKSQLIKLQKQNQELFERTRYLSSYQGSVRRNNTSNNSFTNQSDPERQLEQSYEESLHPLAKFRARETERINSKLGTLERIFLSFAKAILANKTSRLLFLCYCFGLHFLVMIMSIYVMSLYGALTPDVGIVDKSMSGKTQAIP